MNKEEYKKIKIECKICRTKFEIWISIENYSAEVEERIRKSFYSYCPVCKALEETKMNKK
jgi:hypothetical protein